jgi:hypothetical protein
VSRKPTLHTQAHAALLKSHELGKRYLTIEELKNEDRKYWDKVLAEEPLTGEGWEKGEDDESANSAFDSDNWSTDSESNEPRTPRSAASSKSRRLAPSGERLAHELPGTFNETDDWKEDARQAAEQLKEYKEQVRQAIARSERSTAWTTDVSSFGGYLDLSYMLSALTLTLLHSSRASQMLTSSLRRKQSA